MRSANSNRFTRLGSAALLASGIFAIALAAVANDEAPQDAQQTETTPPALAHYKGRRIALTMHWAGAEWLIRETREKEENTTAVVDQLKLKPGMIVADIGCGNGYYTLKVARGVEGKDADGNAGKALGVEIQEEYFAMLKKRAADVGVENIDYVLSTLTDPKLKPGSCDLILMVDVYHEFSHPEHMLQNIRKALKPNGMVVLLEFRMEDENVPIKLLHKMSKAQIMKELPPNGLKLVRQFDDLPWQHMMFFARDDSPLQEIDLEGNAVQKQREDDAP